MQFIWDSCDKVETLLHWNLWKLYMGLVFSRRSDPGTKSLVVEDSTQHIRKLVFLRVSFSFLDAFVDLLIITDHCTLYFLGWERPWKLAAISTNSSSQVQVWPKGLMAYDSHSILCIYVIIKFSPCFFSSASSTASVAQRSRSLASTSFRCLLFLRIFSLPCAMGWAWMGIFSMSRFLFLLWVFAMPAASLRSVMGDDRSMDLGGLWYIVAWWFDRIWLQDPPAISQQSHHTAYGIRYLSIRNMTMNVWRVFETFQHAADFVLDVKQWVKFMFLEKGYGMVSCYILLIIISFFSVLIDSHRPISF